MYDIVPIENPNEFLEHWTIKNEQMHSVLSNHVFDLSKKKHGNWKTGTKLKVNLDDG